MPPPDSSAQEAGDPEVSSQRASPDPVRPEDNPIDPRSPQRPAPEESRQKSLAPSGVRSDVLRELVGRAAISEEKDGISVLSKVFRVTYDSWED